MFQSVPDNLVLIGFSGTGKSTVGRMLSQQLGWPFVDVDQEIVGYFGWSIAAIFAREGEAAFRQVERSMVERACEGRRQVLSLGGGATVDPISRALVRDGNLVVRLEASPETILTRLRHGPGAEERPMLQTAEPLARIRSLLAARSEAYAIAHRSIDTDGRSPREVADEVARLVEDWMEASEEVR